MKKKLIINPLYFSIIVIIVVWLQVLIRNIFFINRTLDFYNSLPQFLFSAFVAGILYVIVVALLLRFSKESYGDIGFDKQKLLRQIRFGVLSGLGIFILDTFIISPIIEGLLPQTAMTGVDKSRLFQQLYYLPILILLTVFKGGFSEELWRIFVLTRFEKCWDRRGLIFAIIIGSLIFGIGHLYQGISAVLSVAIVGVLFSLVYLRKRLAFEVIVAHATYDIVAVILGFVIYYGK